MITSIINLYDLVWILTFGINVQNPPGPVYQTDSDWSWIQYWFQWGLSSPHSPAVLKLKKKLLIIFYGKAVEFVAEFNRETSECESQKWLLLKNLNTSLRMILPSLRQSNSTSFQAKTFGEELTAIPWKVVESLRGEGKNFWSRSCVKLLIVVKHLRTPWWK